MFRKFCLDIFNKILAACNFILLKFDDLEFKQKLYHCIFALLGCIVGLILIYAALLKIEARTPISNQIFLINVDSAQDRLASMRKKLGNANFTRLAMTPADIKFTFVDIKGKQREVGDITMNPESIRRIKDWNTPITVDCGKDDNFIWNTSAMMSPGEFGCFCSHRAIWHEIVKQKLANAIILEDDVVFAPLYKIKLRLLNNNIPSNFDYIDLRKKKRGKWFNFFFKTEINMGWGTESYMLSYEGARKLLEYSRIVDQPIDRFMNDLMLQHKLITFSFRYPISGGQEYGAEKINNTIMR